MLCKLIVFAFLASAWPSSGLSATSSAADVAKQIQESGLDGAECYRVIDLNFSKEDIRVYLASGYLIFAKPLAGRRRAALFTADVEGGDAEVLLLPPIRSERMSLANFTQSPNLNEHFKSALFFFSDETGNDLMAQLKEKGSKRAPEIGGILAEQFSSTVKNVGGSFQVRIVGDTLSPTLGGGFFYMTVSGTQLGNFDILYDPRAQENILVGQIADGKSARFFDVWTSFNSKSRRNGTAAPLREVRLDNYRIDSTIDPDLMVRSVTRVTATEATGRAVGFAISPNMRVLSAKVDGKPAEVFQRESLRSNLMQADGNEEFLVITDSDLEAGKPHEFEIRHEGAVITRAGDQVFFVGARGTWYPRVGSQFGKYDLTFRYPKDLGLVATGDVVEDRAEGSMRITRRTTDAPIRFAGMNLGDYKSATVIHEPYRVQVYANRRLETALQPKAVPLGRDNPVASFPRRRITDPPAEPAQSMPPDPVGRLKVLAENVAAELDFMAGLFGPPPIKSLTVSPIPGLFGQGFPGLLYLSTLAYLDPAQRPAAVRERPQQTFFSEMLDAHEVAHQWWGNLVTTSSYQDAWLMEALANYSALLFLEKKKGPKAFETALDDYKAHLMATGPNGKPLESAGPITWGYRLQSSLSPEAAHYIVYEKGAWVLHMLRRHMGDDRFLAMLKAVCTRYRFQSITTEDFRKTAQEFMPPKTADSDLGPFFENWVYGTGIPVIKLNWVVRGLKVTGTVTQSNVGEDFTARIPIEVQAGKTRSLYWVVSGSEPVPFSLSLKSLPTKVSLAAKDALIVAKK